MPPPPPPPPPPPNDEGLPGSGVGWDTALQEGLIPDGVTAIFHWSNPSGRTNRNEYQVCVSWGVKAAAA